MRLLVLSIFSLVACGGSAPESTTTPAAAASQPTSALALGDARITVVLGKDQKPEVTEKPDGSVNIKTPVRFELVLHPDGNIDAFTKLDSGDMKMPGTTRVTDAGELSFDGKVKVKIDDAGAVTALHESRESVEGKVVKEESEWRAMGVLDASGTFRASQTGVTVRVEPDGSVTGLPAEIEVRIEAADPAVRRTALFLFVASMASTRMESDIHSAPATEEPPAAVPPMTK